MKTRHVSGSRAPVDRDPIDRTPIEWSTFVVARRLGTPAIWTANATLCDRRGEIAPVEIELTVGDGEGELVLRPAARKPQRWGTRKLKRYFAAAHPALDALKRQLERNAS